MQREIRDRIRKLESVLSDIELERQARFEALSTNRATLRFQINRIRETFRRLLHEDTTLVERIRTLFREQGITIASILTAFAWQSRHLCLRSPVVGEVRLCWLPSHLTRAVRKSRWKNTYRPLGAPWLI